MTEIHGDGGPVAHIPDDLTIAQFVLDAEHPSRAPWSHTTRPWLIEEATGREIGSDELRARMHGLSNALKIRWNIGYDETVCIFSPNHVDYPVAMWAVQNLGGIASTANPTYTADELKYQLETIKACMIIVHPSVLPVALDAARAVGLSSDRIILFDPVPGSSHAYLNELVKFGLDEIQQFTPLRFKPGEAKTKLALLSFSSGTTGRPKAVRISHYCIYSNTILHATFLRFRDEAVPIERKIFKPGGITLGVLPFYHAFGMHLVLFGMMYFGQTVVVSPKFSLKQMLESIQRYRINNLTVVPPQVVLLCKSPMTKQYDLSSLTFLLSGGAPLSVEVVDQIANILPNCMIAQGYGTTEAVTGLTLPTPGKRIQTPGSSGTLIPGVIVRVVKPDGSLAGFNELGELHVKMPSISLGYLNNPEATAETYKDGFLLTGDEVYINENKELFIIDRIKELIKVRGAQVAPSELEGHLLDHADVQDTCVIGVPDEYSGELPLAFVALSPAARGRVEKDPPEAERIKEAIMLHVSKHKTRTKWLAGVELVEVIPKNPSGKLLRRVLREQAKEMLARGKIRLQSSARRAKL